MNQKKVLQTLNRIMEFELAGVVRYTHYALMVYGFNRIPIVKWMQQQAEESLTHAQRAGELVTWLGGHPSLGIGPLLETAKHDIGDILQESLAHEKAALKEYETLLELAHGHDVRLEEYARELIAAEVAHQDEVNKMLRRPGQTAVFSEVKTEGSKRVRRVARRSR
jgi:bacterioferritin